MRLAGGGCRSSDSSSLNLCLDLRLGFRLGLGVQTPLLMGVQDRTLPLAP